MTGALQRHRTAYEQTLREHVARPGEATLRDAYELGREAVGADLSVLDLAAVHHDALAELLAERTDAAGAADVARAAGDVLRETLSAFEMVRRGFQEARDTAALRLRQAAMVRQLSTFLTDSSLVLVSEDALAEVLHLVAEQARELTDARACLAALSMRPHADPVRAASHDEDDAVWAELAGVLDPADVYPGEGPGPLRLTADELARHPALRGAGADAARTWLAAGITRLDGRVIGSIQLFDSRDGAFSDLDEAVLVHLAQMASAAVERALLYEG